MTGMSSTSTLSQNHSPSLPSSSKTITICTVGSRGDVQPYIVLGLALRTRGHNVRVATEERLRPLVEEFGMTFAKIDGDSTGLLFQAEAQPVLQEGSFFKLIKLTKAWEAKQPPKAQILASYEAACAGSDIVIGAGLTLTQSLCMAQKLNASWIPVILGPTYPTSEYPLWALKSLACCSCLNKWTYNVVFNALWGQEEKSINAWRTGSLGLAALPKKGQGSMDVIRAQQTPVIICASPLISGPNQRVPGDYPAFVHMHGFLFAPNDGIVGQATIDPRVEEFVASGDIRPGVYLGFGSMPAPDPSALVKLALDTCVAAGCRGILVAGWADLESDPTCGAIVAKGAEDKTLLVVKSVPHGWLFPRMRAVVHHCGVGTMAAALRAGIPQVPVPFMLDQPHNASLLVKLGVAPSIIPFKKINASALSKALKSVLSQPRDGPLYTTAKRIAQQVETESARAAEVCCSLIETAKPMPSVV